MLLKSTPSTSSCVIWEHYYCTPSREAWLAGWLCTAMAILHLRSVLLLLSLCGLTAHAASVSTPKLSGVSDGGYLVEGRVKVQGVGWRGLPSKTVNVKVILNGGQQLTFVRPDGYFSFQGVSAGTHLLEIAALGYYFSPVRVDVSARLNGQVSAIAVETRRSYSDPLILEPLKEEYYYEKREPFSAMALLKSPMGMMVSFMVVAVVLLPKLMDNIDPEEMKRVQEEMRNQPTPSLASLLPGRS